MPTKKRFTEDSFRKEPWFRALAQAMLSARSEEEMADLLRDVGALSELQAWAERLEVAKQLVKGLSYRQVAAVTGASTTTVTRVARAIENGTGGYRKLLHASRHHRMIKKVEQNIQQELDKNSRNVPEVPEAKSPPAPKDLLQKYLDK